MTHAADELGPENEGCPDCFGSLAVPGLEIGHGPC